MSLGASCLSGVIGRLLDVFHDGELSVHQYQSWPSGGVPVLLSQQSGQSLGVQSGLSDDAQLVVPLPW